MTSMTSARPFINLDLSNAVRLGFTGFVADVSRQVAGHNVTINNLLPGSFATARARTPASDAEKIIKTIRVGRFGEPKEFSDTRAFLCSISSAYITGQNVLIDGGFCMNTL